MKGAALPCCERGWGGWVGHASHPAGVSRRVRREDVIQAYVAPTCFRQAASHSSDTTGMPSSVARCVFVYIYVCVRARKGW